MDSIVGYTCCSSNVHNRYQERASNQHDAQIIFTTYETVLLNWEILCRDQIYFADKSWKEGDSTLYSLVKFKVRNALNIRKSYLLGKFGGIPKIEEVR